MTLVRQRLLIFFFPLLLSAPFLNRAFFVDDSYFVQIAQWLSEHPGRPYDFRTDDAGIDNPGWEADGFVRMVNPLAHHYFLAGLIKMGFDRVWMLRTGCVLIGCFGALCLFELARRWTSYPLLATALTLSTPAIWLTNHSLLIDSTMGALFFAAVYLFVRGGERDSVVAMAASGLVAGISMLAKYPAVFFFPLTFVWWALYWRHRRRKWIPIVSWIVGLSILAWYGWFTQRLYGEPHILAASRRMVQVFGWPKLIVFSVFFSGVTLAPFVSWAFLSRLRLAAAVTLAASIALLFRSDVGGFGWIPSILIALMATTFVMFVWVLAFNARNWVYPRDVFLIVWTLGFIGMMALVMDWVAARYFVIVVPPVVFLAVRLSEMRWGERALGVLRFGLVAFVVFGAALGYADYRGADPSRELPTLLKKAGFKGGDGRFFMGDAFTMSYLRADGWIPYFPGTELQPGDLVVTKQVTMPPIYPWRTVPLEIVAVFDFPSSFPIKVMDFEASAGFYASVWGALPYAISFGPWERFVVFRVGSEKDPA